MTGEAMREVFEAVLPNELVEGLASLFGVTERERVFDIATFVRCSIIAAGSPSGGLQADTIRNYLEAEGTPMARSAFYRKFDDEYEALMETLAQHALEYARAQQVDLPGILAGVTDWRIVDSSTVKVSDKVKKVLPGTGDYAAIKVHKTYSVGCNAPVAYHFSAAREHDARHLAIDESWRGYGLLADLGYASFERLRACMTHDVKFVIRLKENWKAKVTAVARGEIARIFFVGSDLDVLLEDETLPLNGKPIDATVRVGTGKDALELRLVGVPTPKGYCFFLTNLPSRISAIEVGDIYRVRWEVELSFKLDKGAYRLDEGKGRRTCSIKALLHASLIASVITGLLVHKHTLETRPARPGEQRTRPPLHQGLVAKCLLQWSYSVARAFELEGDAAAREWDRLAAALTRGAADPSWRSRPSVLDRIRGWGGRPPVRARRSSRAVAARSAK
ncbi:MAG: IS4 family transposase [Myxococcaceae bacterium]